MQSLDRTRITFLLLHLCPFNGVSKHLPRFLEDSIVMKVCTDQDSANISPSF
jgi:hypothetical protein